MSQGLGMSLDDYIKVSKPKGGNGYGNNSGRYRSGGGGFNKPQRFKPQNSGNYGNRYQRNEDFEGQSGAFNKVNNVISMKCFEIPLEKELGT